MIIGDRIKHFRNRKGLTQKELGEAIGFDSRTADVRIAQYEKGTRNPKKKYTDKIAEVLDVSEQALEIPEIDTVDCISLFQFLFALEDENIFTIDENADNIPCLKINGNDTSSKNAIFTNWMNMKKLLLNGEITLEEYDDWRYKLPFGESEEIHIKLEEIKKELTD
jgi:transcriptional regulator with XRE-family HTH domain